jgi:hypothetical protein
MHLALLTISSPSIQPWMRPPCRGYVCTMSRDITIGAPGSVWVSGHSSAVSRRPTDFGEGWAMTLARLVVTASGSRADQWPRRPASMGLAPGGSTSSAGASMPRGRLGWSFARAGPGHARRTRPHRSGLRTGSRLVGKRIRDRGRFACLRHGFDVLNFAEIEALSFPENEPSIRVLLKLGFACEDTASRFGVELVRYKVDADSFWASSHARAGVTSG